MRKIIIPLLLLCFFLTSSAQINDLERTSPESAGIKSEIIQCLFDKLTALPNVDIHSIMILRHGEVIGEVYPKPFSAEYKHTIYSCSKTFVSAAIGIAIDENRLRLDDRVAPFFTKDLPLTITNELADMTIRDLLTMSAGIAPDWNMRNLRKDWAKGYFSKNISSPGKVFKYDSLCSYILSAIIQKVTDKTLLEYLKLRLFEPMNIWDVAWEESPEGYNTGGWGLYIQPESMAKFGQLLLNKGEWAGKQLISKEWIDTMMTRQIEAGREDYGYHIWMCDTANAWRADGAYGQYIIVIPQKDMVIVVTQCCMANAQHQRNIIWHTLVDNVGDTPLQPGKAYSKLLQKQKEYAYPTIKGNETSWKASAINGKTINLSKNSLNWKSIKLSFRKNELTATITDMSGTLSTIKAGYNQWTTSSLGNYPPYSIKALGRYKGLKNDFHSAANYAWNRNGNALEIKVHFVDWISALGITLRFVDLNKVNIEIKANFENKPYIISGNII